MRPLIGITGTRHVIQTNPSSQVILGAVSGDDYSHGVEAAGGIPLIIPYVNREDTIHSIAEQLDGLLLAGGEDVDPSRWGDEPQIGLGQIVPERDELEIALIRCMLDEGKPILGICRGMQILNVALGGSLYQDMEREWDGKIQHKQRARRNHLSHSLRIEPQSKLFEMIGRTTEIRCNSFHHEAVKRLGTNLIPTAWDAEGLVEAMELVGPDYVLAVQWHPENLWRTHPEHLGVFLGLVNAARRRSQSH